MANSISGNAGVAGAAIALTGTSTASTTSAANGTYSFSGLAAGAYVVTPTLAGVTFTPAFLNETIVATNITTANFVAQATGATFTPTISDTFHRTDAATLGSNWTPTTDINTALAIVSDLAVANSIALNGSEIYTGKTFGNNQSASITIGAMAPFAEIDFWVRADITGSTGYAVALFNDNGVISRLTLTDIVAGIALDGGQVILSSAPQLGDVLSVQAVGTLITVFYNGVPVLSGTSATTASGSPILVVTPAATQTDVSVSLFTAGPVPASSAPVTASSGTFSTSSSSNAEMSTLFRRTQQITTNLEGKNQA